MVEFGHVVCTVTAAVQPQPIGSIRFLISFPFTPGYLKFQQRTESKNNNWIKRVKPIPKRRQDNKLSSDKEFGTCQHTTGPDGRSGNVEAADEEVGENLYLSFALKNGLPKMVLTKLSLNV